MKTFFERTGPPHPQTLEAQTEVLVAYLKEIEDKEVDLGIELDHVHVFEMADGKVEFVPDTMRASLWLAYEHLVLGKNNPFLGRVTEEDHLANLGVLARNYHVILFGHYLYVWGNQLLFCLADVDVSKLSDLSRSAKDVFEEAAQPYVLPGHTLAGAYVWKGFKNKDKVLLGIRKGSS